MSVQNQAPKLTYFGDSNPPPFTFKTKKGFNVVNYFGIPIAVPKGLKWLAMDDSGSIYGYADKPRLRSGSWHSQHECYLLCDLCDLCEYVDFPDETAFKVSRIKVKKLPKFYP